MGLPGGRLVPGRDLFLHRVCRLAPELNTHLDPAVRTTLANRNTTERLFSWFHTDVELLKEELTFHVQINPRLFFLLQISAVPLTQSNPGLFTLKGENGG